MCHSGNSCWSLDMLYNMERETAPCTNVNIVRHVWNVTTMTFSFCSIDLFWRLITGQTSPQYLHSVESNLHTVNSHNVTCVDQWSISISQSLSTLADDEWTLQSTSYQRMLTVCRYELPAPSVFHCIQDQAAATRNTASSSSSSSNNKFNVPLGHGTKCYAAK